MKAPYNFIISPVGEQYSNTKNIGGVEFTFNTSLDLAKYVNRVAVVIELPTFYKGDISVGDIVVIHHNIFRTYHDMKGRQTKSPEFFRDELYIVDPNRIYLYKSNGVWKSHLNYCFVRPIAKIQDQLLNSVEKEEKHIGVIVYPSKHQEENLKLKSGSLVAFTKNSEYEFEIDGEKIYRMYDRDVVIELSEL
ncbi:MULTISPECIES: hypothetical protein [Flavobacteriaceae]|uniref:hypothetical protein n=1 Tax=Flavobacteriaceae TaxID=49546 RepID=UPI0025FED650|nr:MULTISPECIES: hypothetical protein [Flavobacteriaceae]